MSSIWGIGQTLSLREPETQTSTSIIAYIKLNLIQ